MKAARTPVAVAAADTERLLEQTVRIDASTGLPNRRAWDERLEVELADERRHRRGLVVALVDLGRCARVDNEPGHAAGDELLRQVAVEWREWLRPSDLLARYGAEELAMALPGCDAQTAAQVFERVLAATPAGPTCAIGAACARPEESPAEVLARSDRAICAAKTAGRDRVVVVDGG